MNNPLVIGYRGEIGSFILQGLLKHMPKALNILCFDINESIRECTERIKKADVIFLCVPIEETNQFISTWYKELEGKTLIEQTSLKYLFFECKHMKEKLKNINILSMHILFRPSVTPNREDREIAFIDPMKWKTSGLLWKIKKITNSKSHYFFHDYKDHDRGMAIQQTMLHRVLLSIDKCLEVDFHTTYIAKQIKKLVNRIKNGDPILYEAIQNFKYSKHALDKFNKSLNNFDFDTYFKKDRS
ncbi:MAG: hypothetical protein ACTSWK_17675 [Promethearchaeota archaeon]